MNTNITAALAALALTGLFFSLLLAVPAAALGPVDAELGAVYWANDFDVNNVSTDSGAPGFRGEVWLNNTYGLRAGRYSSDLNDIGGDSSDYTSVDLLWKPIAPTQNNFVAFGLGWQQTDLADLGFADDTTGLRLAAEGRVGLGGLFYGYGHAAYMPSMDGSPASDGFSPAFADIESTQFELGVTWKAAPFISLRAGYRQTNVDFTQGPTDLEAESSGFLFGTGFHF